MKKYAVIVAGGSGSRMQSDLPKQFLEINGRPMLMHTLEAFYNYDSKIQLILVLPSIHLTLWKDLIATHGFDTPHLITEGGTTRFDSVKNGLAVIHASGLVAIHDGARPLVTAAVIGRTFEMARISGNATAAVPIKDSIRQVEKDHNRVIDRSLLYAIQTPQTFQIEIIKKAFEQSTSNQFTDDASVLEAYGEKIHLVEGSEDNLKVTTPEDLVLATAILGLRKQNA